MPDDVPLHEAILGSTVIRDLGLTIAGTRLEPLVARARSELQQAGLGNLKPRFYLSTEWGVPFGSTSVAIPFYLARAELTELHARHTGHVQGTSDAEILRYLRHELGHVVNYAWHLYDDERWVMTFGAITAPYLEEFHPVPFSRRHVRHLPGWYAQKHPDDDWAETFAVWLTPGGEWRSDYAGWPEALAKLELCETLLQEVRDKAPPQRPVAPEEEHGALDRSLAELYGDERGQQELELPPGLDGALRSIFEDLGAPESAPAITRLPASDLLRKMERDLVADVFRWTGHGPERTWPLLQRVEERLDELCQVYPAGHELQAATALTAMITALAINYVHRGSYLP